MNCSIESCPLPAKTRDLCSRHYQRLHRLGDPLAGGPPRSTTRQSEKPCSAEGCHKLAMARKLCPAHYRRLTVHGSLTADHRRKATTCSIDGCTRSHLARGWCSDHYDRWRRYGAPTAKAPFGRNGKSIRAGGPGNRRTDSNGYVQIYWPEHPNARSGGQVSEHTVIMTEVLGRALLVTESVHHKNGRRADNRSGNLELWARYQPFGQRVKDLITFANEIVDRYGTDPTAYP